MARLLSNLKVLVAEIGSSLTEFDYLAPLALFSNFLVKFETRLKACIFRLNFSSWLSKEEAYLFYSPSMVTPLIRTKAFFYYRCDKLLYATANKMMQYIALKRGLKAKSTGVSKVRRIKLDEIGVDSVLFILPFQRYSTSNATFGPLVL